MITQTKFTWEDFDIHVKAILAEIKKRQWNIKGIYAIPKGGLPLGVALANSLNVPLYLDIKSMKLNQHILVVDDISDSGKTMIEMPGIVNSKTVTLYIKEGTRFVPNYYCRTACKEEWIVFPWESLDKEMKRDGTVEQQPDNVEESFFQRLIGRR